MISPAFISSLAAFQVAASGLVPLSRATAISVAAVVNQGQAAILAAGAALSNAGAALDIPDPSGFPAAYPAALLALSAAADDSSGLSDVAGYLGRATFNIQQAKP